MPIRYFVFLVCLFVTGCQNSVELNSGLSEQEANDIISELASKHIDANKQTTKTGVSVFVDAVDMPRAVRILNAVGLPREQRTNMGVVFKKDGIISTPLEERARYIYALSQELESTLSEIDGVVVARVQVVLPERVAPGEPVQPASASVFIKYTHELDPDIIRPRISRLIQSSIMGLDDPNKLSIIFVPAATYKESQPLVSFGPFLIKSENKSFWVWTFIITMVFLLLLIVGGIAFLIPGVRQFLLGLMSRKPPVSPQ